LVVDERLVNALVEHASGTVADKGPPAKVSPKKSGDGAAAEPEAKETAVATAEPEVKEATVAADDPEAKEAAKVE
jgi:hypothetical protein